METKTYIDTLLKKYQQAPDFPFENWHSDTVSFYAAMNLWDDIFKTAAGQEASNYVASTDVEMSTFSDIYQVVHVGKTKKLGIYTEPEGGTFSVLTSYGQDGGPDRFELSLAMDLDRNRLICAFEMIRAYTKAELKTVEDGQALHGAFVERYKEYFGFPDWDPFAPVSHDDDDEDDVPD